MLGDRVRSLKLIVFAALAASAVLAVPRGVLSADCFDSYGRPIECPIQVDVDKQVRLESSTAFADSLAGVLDGQRLVYRIVVTNKNTAPVSNLTVRDLVIDPAERDNVKFVSSSDLAKQGDDLVANIAELLPGESQTFLYTSVASAAGIAEGASLTVDNEVRILAGDDVVASDIALITIKRGAVLAAESLPKTGPSDILATSLYLGYLGFLVRRIKLTRYL